MDQETYRDTENLILNLDNPLLAEQFRIRKLVEDKFGKLEEEIKAQLQEKSNRNLNKENNKINIKTKNKSNAVQVARRSSQSKKEKSKLESTNSVNSQPAELYQTLESPLLPIDPPKAPKHFQSPDFTRNESEKDDVSFPKFEVLPTKHPQPFIPLSSPRLIRVENRGRNTGVFEFEHRQPANDVRYGRHSPVLTAHVIPGVDIKPQLTIECIPGISIPTVKSTRHPNITVISKSYLEKQQPNLTNLNDNNDDISVSITNSTTSKFEELEKVLFENNDDLSNNEAEIKRKLRNRVREILISKYNLDLSPRPDSLDTGNILNNFKSESDKSSHRTKHEKSSSESSRTESQKNSKSKLVDNYVPSTREKNHEPIMHIPEEPQSNKSNSYSSSFEKTSSYDKTDSNASSKNSSSSEKVSENPNVRYVPKPLSTILEVSSHKTKTQDPRPTVEPAVAVEDFATEHISITADLDDDDTLAESCLELHTDDHNKESKSSESKNSLYVREGQPMQSGIAEKESQHSDQIKYNDTQNEERKKSIPNIESNFDSRSKIDSLNSKACLISKASNKRTSSSEKAISSNKSMTKVDLNPKIHSTVEDMIESIIENDIFGAVFHQDNKEESEPSILDESKTDIENVIQNTKTKDEIYLTDINMDLSISTGPLDTSSCDSSNELEKKLDELKLETKSNSQSLSIKDEIPSNKDALQEEKQVLSVLSSYQTNSFSFSQSKIPQKIEYEKEKDHLSSSDKSLSIERSRKNSNTPKDKIENEESMNENISSIVDYTASTLPPPISRGEIIAEVVANLFSDGEVDAGSSLDTSQSRQELSEGEHVSVGNSDSSSAGLHQTPLTSSSASGPASRGQLEAVVTSLSSGEWQASPRQIQRLARFADSFGFCK